jgi:hypothetical protein
VSFELAGIRADVDKVATAISGAKGNLFYFSGLFVYLAQHENGLFLSPDLEASKHAMVLQLWAVFPS